MKTIRFSVVACCAMLTGFNLLPLDAQTADSQTSTTSSTAAPSTKADDNTKSPRLSDGLDDIVQLTKAGVDQSVILTFIQGSQRAFVVTSQDITQLSAQGVSPQVTSALINRGNAIRQANAEAYQQAQTTAANAAATTQPTSPPPATSQPTIIYAAAPEPAPNPVSVVYIGQPTYTVFPHRFGFGTYYYPNYAYYPYHSSDYNPRVSFGVRIGGTRFSGFHGGFHRGFRGGFGRHR